MCVSSILFIWVLPPSFFLFFLLFSPSKGFSQDKEIKNVNYIKSILRFKSTYDLDIDSTWIQRTVTGQEY